MPFVAETIAFEASGTKQPSAGCSGKRLVAKDHVLQSRQGNTWQPYAQRVRLPRGGDLLSAGKRGSRFDGNVELSEAAGRGRVPVCLSHHGTRRKGCLGIGNPTLQEKGQPERNKTPHLPPPVPRGSAHSSWAVRVRIAAPAMQKAGGPKPPTRRRVCGVLCAAGAQSKVGGARQGETRPDDIDLGGKDAIFSWKNTTSIATFVSFAALRFFAKKGPSFRLPLHVARCTLPPANRQDRIRSLVGAVTFTSTSASRLTLSSLPPAAARRPANAAKASSRLGKAVGAARHEAALSLKY